MMGFMNHCQSVRVNTIMCIRMVIASLFAPSTFVHQEKLVITDDLVPPSIGIKTNFIIVTYLSRYCFNLLEAIGDVHILYQGLIVFRVIPGVFNSFLFLACIFSVVLMRSITEFLSSFLLSLVYIRYIYWDTRQEILGLLCFSLF